MTEGNFPGKECTKQLLLYLLTGDVKANFSRNTITLPNLIMAQFNVKANFRESRDTITLPNLIMAQYNVKANFIESRYYYIAKLDYGAMQRFRQDKIA